MEDSVAQPGMEPHLSMLVWSDFSRTRTTSRLTDLMSCCPSSMSSTLPSSISVIRPCIRSFNTPIDASLARDSIENSWWKKRNRWFSKTLTVASSNNKQLKDLPLTHREHASYDAAVQLENVLLVQPVVSHVRVVDEPQLHEGGDEELVDVSRHDICFVLLTQHLVDLWGQHKQFISKRC